jgi:hypothetical protein
MPREALNTRASKPGVMGVPSSTLSAFGARDQLLRIGDVGGRDLVHHVGRRVAQHALGMRSAPTLKIWMTPLASVAILEKLALLKIAFCRAPALSKLRLDVDILSNTVQRAAHLVEQAKGYIQAQRVDDDNAHLTVRVPAGALSPTISALSALGSATVVRVSSSDITEQYVDTESRMKTARALRDRLQGLLDRATNVTEVLSVERELARVQAEIEASEARLRAMAGQVDLATLEVYLQRRTPPAEEARTIYGPVGLVVKGLGWVLEKLWIIRE